MDKVNFHPVSGFLGAGKTTTLLAAARLLRERGGRPAILTNDQGSDLVGSVAGLLDVAGSDARRDVEIDYDRYAAAEAELAWLNRAVEIAAPGGFAPADWAVAALTALSRACAATGVLIGHAKLTVAGADGGFAKASVVAAGAAPEVDLVGPAGVPVARAVFNLRVAWEPAELDRACAAAIGAADSLCGTRSDAEPGRVAFRPAYPRPTHRL